MSFAEQLSLLDEYQCEKAMPKAKKSGEEVTEIRDVADPMYVSKWLLAFLSNSDSNVVTGNDFPRIVKKLRDDVIYKGGILPFRRSGLWTAMKVSLRLNLEAELERDTAYCIYKIIQIRFASKMCEFLLDNRYQTIDAGIAMHMLAKVARKIDKLSTTLDRLADKVKCESLFNSVTRNSKKTILQVREKVNQQFYTLDLFDRKRALLEPLDFMDFQRDSIHEIPSLTAYLKTRLASANSSSRNFCLEPQPIPRHRVNVPTFPNYKFEAVKNEVHLSLLLADVENWVLENSTKCSVEHALSLRDLAVKYGAAAKNHYKNDPLGGSRMILTILQIIRVLDQIATEEYPMLAQHHSGINPKIIEDLLLPFRHQMKVASDLENYFEQRNSEASFPALNAEKTVTDKSFSYRYAEDDLEMRELRKQILDEQKKQIESKMAEVKRARLNILRWKEEAKRLEHEFLKIWSAYEYRTVHDYSCKLCRLWKNCTKSKVEVYERAIKNDELSQYAIVFELIIPTEISCLRDVLQFAAHEFFFTAKSDNELKIKGNWIDYEQISCHQEEWDRRVHLGSTCLLYMRSHYPKEIHAESDDSEFVVNNGYNCVYYGSGNIELFNDIKKQSVKRFCKFHVESNSPYRNLQWTLSNTNHFQNDILACQNECPIELNLSEYVAFGSLRSDGHRLQMRNIYRVLATETLSFEKESVAVLIIQALWQAGPKSANLWIRESHEDLADGVFASEMLDMLHKYASSQQDNWKHPLKMMIIILIATRILELNSNRTIITTAINVLLYCRCICDDWMARIQTVKSKCDCRDQDQIQNLCTNMVDAGICCALTFYASSKLKAFPQLWQSMTTNSALSYWLNAVVNVSNNIVSSTTQDQELSKFRRIFLRQMWIIGINSENLLLQLVTKGIYIEIAFYL